MEDAVSSLAGDRRIQTMPEIASRNTGGESLTSARPAPIRYATYGTWPVFSLALVALLGLMLVPAVTALRRSEAIYEEIRASQEQFQRTQQVFEGLSQSMFTISLTIREFLLDSSPDAGRGYRARVSIARDALQADIARLEEVLPPDGGAALHELKQQVDDYLAVVVPVFDWTSEERVARGSYFLRQEQRPRRETILSVASQLSQLNAAIYAQQQHRTTESEQWFRRELTKSVLFALLAGVLISTGGILRMRSLERRTAEHRQRMEQTTEEIRDLSVRLRQAQEEERRTISRELHDDVGQQLTAMRMELGTLERLHVAHDAEFGSRLTEVKTMAEQSLHMIRDIAAGLRPSMLDDLGLAAAVKKQAREFAKRTGVPVSVTVDGAFEHLRDPHRTYIYRVVQEALTNCAKHAHAHQISVALVESVNMMTLTISDDGIGFDRGRLPRGGLGLIGMEERVRELGGTASVRSSPGHGTTIHVTIPLS